jgi:NitT/TauT family transport system substrate-binding protein
MVKRISLVMLLVLILASSLFAAPALTKFTFISPRGTLEVMDDYDLWVAIDMGYFKELGLDVDMEPGPQDAFACTKYVDQNKADIGYPSPGILTSAIDSGQHVIQVYEMMVDQVFDFAVRPDSPIHSIKDFAGKTIAINFAGSDVIVSPILVEAGVDPKSVTYVSLGSETAQIVAAGKADIALTWKGLRAQWDAQGLQLRYLLGETYSKMPSNGYCARVSDLKDPAKRDLLVRFLRGTSMGLHFTRFNPRAAAQITYNRFAAVREQMTPQLALASMQQLHWMYTGGARMGQGYGWSPVDRWKTYLGIIAKLGQTQKLLMADNVVTNDLIKDANNFDHARVERDAKNFKLNDDWKTVVVVAGEW